MPAFIDLSNMRFGHLIALSKEKTSSDGQAVWLCKCDCGNYTNVKSGNLRSGHTQSCGCYMKKQISKAQTVHGESHNRLYNVWSNMKSRCYNPNNTYYPDYGGRGIEVCKEWRNNYTAFHKWSLENGYDENAPKYVCTIDRINNDGNYEPSNCRWVDMKVQRHNRRNKRNI